MEPSAGLTVRGLGASGVALTQQTSLCDDEVVLICVNDSLGVGRRAMELLRLGVAAFGWVGAYRQAERICRHARPDVKLVSEDEKSPGYRCSLTSVPSSLCSAVVIFASCTMSGKGSVEPCEKDCWHDDDGAVVVQICLSQLSRGWPSVRACLLEGSVSLSLHACERVSADMNAQPFRINASDFLSCRARETVLVFFPCELVLGVSKQYFTHKPYFPHFRAARRESLNVFCFNGEYSGRFVGFFHLIALQQLW